MTRQLGTRRTDSAGKRVVAGGFFMKVIFRALCLTLLAPLVVLGIVVIGISNNAFGFGRAGDGGLKGCPTKFGHGF
ncbi:hypothetical protein ACN20G_36655 (plasmid) [Streptomyces sp. BI20]|uniref:hypothetical protein n=1 Tax=Streptomyces sp. BI20 TaxID=3403460 RepID=UPI003C77439F